MHLYLVTANGPVGWDETHSVVVRATDETAARLAVDAHAHSWNSEHVASADYWSATEVPVDGPAEIIVSSQR
jgi:hypothetical protein